MNPGNILTDVRDILDEATAGEWSDVQLWRFINRSYKYYCRKCTEFDAAIFIARGTITLVADQQEYSVGVQRKLTKLLWVEDITTDPYTSQIPIDFRKRLIWEAGTDTVYGTTSRYHYYVKDWKIGLSPTPDTAVTNALQYWYAFIPEDLSYGTLGAADSTTITLATTPTLGETKLIDDIYNGEWFEVSNYRAQATDYTGSTKKATVTFGATPAGTETYYMVPQLEEDFWDMITMRAAIRALARVEDDTSEWRRELESIESDFYASLNTRQMQEPRYVNMVE